MTPLKRNTFDGLESRLTAGNAATWVVNAIRIGILVALAFFSRWVVTNFPLSLGLKLIAFAAFGALFLAFVVLPAFYEGYFGSRGSREDGK